MATSFSLLLLTFNLNVISMEYTHAHTHTFILSVDETLAQCKNVNVCVIILNKMCTTIKLIPSPTLDSTYLTWTVNEMYQLPSLGAL